MTLKMPAILSFESAIVLIVLIASILDNGTFAQPLNDYNPRSRYECPPMPPNCSCSFVMSDIEIQCPIIEPSIIVRIQPSTYVQIECVTNNEEDYAMLPEMQVGDTPTVQIRRCPLPRGQSLESILKRIGTTRVRAFHFQRFKSDLGNSLNRGHLKGFENLTRLILNGNGLTDLPADLFNDLSNLTWLELKSNRVHLPPDIFANLEKLEYLELGSNELESLEDGIFRNQKRLKHLNLWSNNLQNLKKASFGAITSIVDLDLSSNKLKTLNSNVFHLLTNLEDLHLSGNNFTSLPEGLLSENKKLRRLRLLENKERMETLPSGFLSNLPALQDVRIRSYLKSLPANLFNGSADIRTIVLSGNELSRLPETLLYHQINLTSLDLSRNKLVELHDNLFANVQSLRELQLSYNNLVNISRALFSHLEKLELLYLNNNNLHRIEQNAFIGTKSLTKIDLYNNYLTLNNGLMDFYTNETTYPINSPLQNLNNLTSLNLRNNSISTMFSDWMYELRSLEKLDLSYNKFQIISSNDFQFSAQQITVNLSHNAIEEVNFLGILYMEPVKDKQMSIVLEQNPIECNCVILHFVQFLQGHIAQKMQKNFNLIADQLQCSKPENLAKQYVPKVSPRDLLCALDAKASSVRRCPEDCECWVQTVESALIVNCSNAGLTEVPPLPMPPGLDSIILYIENNTIMRLPQADHPGYTNVKEIYARNNNITQFSVGNIAPNLRILDLSNNYLAWMNSTVFRAFNRTSQLKRLSLGNNPWRCDCEALQLLSFVQTNYKRIQDLNTVHCVGGAKLLNLKPNDLCEEDQALLIAVCVIVALVGLFIGITASLYYRYQAEVKVWLFAHNMLLWFVTEEEVDKDKKYDAFVSFSHKDEEFVTEQLIPNLENGPTPFKICVHMRDWVPGEFISNQIIKSVENSRRTIVVLSPNFLESDWGRMEFQTAHSSAIQEGRARVIIIIYGEIGDMVNLDPELKAYLNMNTYVKWNDPWFWDKLRYAMPHPSSHYGRKGLVKTSMKSSIDDKLELIKPVPVTPPLTTPPAEQAAKNPLVSKLNGTNVGQHGNIPNGLNGHVNGAFIINTNAKQSDV